MRKLKKSVDVYCLSQKTMLLTNFWNVLVQFFFGMASNGTQYIMGKSDNPRSNDF